jgi:hypothetical protein
VIWAVVLGVMWWVGGVMWCACVYVWWPWVFCGVMGGGVGCDGWPMGFMEI